MKHKFVTTERAIAYIDGFNLYFGLRTRKLRHCYWLNVHALASNLLRPGQQLLLTKYFTARITGSRAGVSPERAKKMDEKRKRQSDFLEAVQTLPDVRLYEGHFLDKEIQCRKCAAIWRSYEEKMTDVQMATQMIVDAFTDAFDLALLISADSDLVPPVKTIRRHFPHKRVIVALPPGRTSVDLKRAANAAVDIPVGILESSQFPDQIIKEGGFILKRPDYWK